MKPAKILLPAGALAALGLAAGIALSDDRGKLGEQLYERVSRDIAPVHSPSYAQECGSCHFAYPPGLLPAASWQRIMDRLTDHFGDNAELSADTAAEIREYLLVNAADRAGIGRSAGFSRYDTGWAPPLRITETPYFMAKHRELPRRIVQDNPQVRSLSRCDACHTGAAEGSFSERGIRIPGVGRWDD